MLEKFSLKRAKNKDKPNPIDPNQIPNHVAIIMDGNGRWAKRRGLPRVAGHHEGMNVVKKITREASQLGIRVLTLYAFSTENWKRPKDEVDFLMKLPEQFLSTFLPELNEENVQVQLMGDQHSLPEHTLKAVEHAKEATASNDGMILNFALNYGSRYEMIMAIKDVAMAVQKGDLKIEDIDESQFSNYLFSSQLPDPDLLIRTSGELRLSNFMLWQLAYTELWFTNIYWPDFKEDTLREAVGDFQKRVRRYGGVKG